jgi:putative transcriptional regulator
MHLKGKFLIARPSITDPFFKKSVVCIYEHTAQATVGLVLNKRTPTLQLKDILSNRGYDSIAVDPIYMGGPVNERSISLLHTGNWYSSNTMPVNSQISISSDDLMIYKFVNGDVPDGFRFFLGSAVWHPKQIAHEIHNNNWLISDLDYADIFNYEGREMWDRAIEINARETIEKFF